MTTPMSLAAASEVAVASAVASAAAGGVRRMALTPIPSEERDRSVCVYSRGARRPESVRRTRREISAAYSVDL